MSKAYRIKGIQRQRIVRNGKVYVYLRHRATGKRIAAEEGTAAFIEEVKSLDDSVSDTKSLNAAPGTWGWLVGKYLVSPEFDGLADRTKSEYVRYLNLLIKLNPIELTRITSESLFSVRDAAHKKHGVRTANYVLSVISLVWSWGKPRGLTPGDGNPAKGFPKVKRDRNALAANRPWTDREIATVLEAAKGGIKVAVALGIFTGQRQADVLHLDWDAIREGYIILRQRKTGAELSIPMHPTLRTILAEAGPFDGVVVKNKNGNAYTSDGFRTSFFKLIRSLEREGRVGAGLTFHGLRHTIATRLADAGAGAELIQSITGHARREMVDHYTKTADQKRRADEAMGLLGARSAPARVLKIPKDNVKK